MCKRTFLLLTACLPALGACSDAVKSRLPVGSAAYAIAPAASEKTADENYFISPGDELYLQVFDEPELSVPKLIVDASGHIQVPLAGSVKVAGLTAQNASRLLETALGARYLRHPQVAINVTVPAERTVSVEGEVNKAGVYPITGGSTLLSAISMAQSPSKVAKLDDVVILRDLKGERKAARFDIRRIRAGIDADPQVLAGDVVVVGFSASKSFYRDLLAAAPLINVFSRF